MLVKQTPTKFVVEWDAYGAILYVKGFWFTNVDFTLEFAEFWSAVSN